MFVTVCHYVYVATGIRFAKAISKQSKGQNQNSLNSEYIVIADSNDDKMGYGFHVGDDDDKKWDV